MVFRNMSPSETTGNFSVAPAQCFTENAGLQLQIIVSAFPAPPHSDSGEGDCFRGLTTVRLRYDLLLGLPSLSELTGHFIQPTRTFTSELPTVWSPAPSSDITTVPTGQSAPAGLAPARSSTSFTALYGQSLPVLRRCCGSSFATARDNCAQQWRRLQEISDCNRGVTVSIGSMESRSKEIANEKRMERCVNRGPRYTQAIRPAKSLWPL